MLGFELDFWEYATFATAALAGGSVMPGVYLYQLTETGLSASLTLSGTRIFKDDDLD